MSIAFVIVTYHAIPYLEGLFTTLVKFTDLSDSQIIVVENASNDGTLEELQRRTEGLANVEILPQSRNTGFAEGNNIGMARARELDVEYVVLLNQDLELEAGWLEPLLTVMRTRPEVAAAQPLILLHSDPRLINTSGNHLHFCGFAYCGDYRREVSTLPADRAVVSVGYASGAALALRMSALDRSGYFDESLFLYHEDCELQIRLRELGYECVLVPEARVQHKYNATFSPKKYAFLERNRWLVLLQHWPLWRLIAIAPALFGTELAVLFFSIKAGWFREKLGTYQEIAQQLPSILRKRKKMQALRVKEATDASILIGAMQFEGLDHPIVTHFANPLLTAYWAFARGVLRVK